MYGSTVDSYPTPKLKKFKKSWKVIIMYYENIKKEDVSIVLRWDFESVVLCVYWLSRFEKTFWDSFLTREEKGFSLSLDLS